MPREQGAFLSFGLRAGGAGHSLRCFLCFAQVYQCKSSSQKHNMLTCSFLVLFFWSVAHLKVVFTLCKTTVLLYCSWCFKRSTSSLHWRSLLCLTVNKCMSCSEGFLLFFSSTLEVIFVVCGFLVLFVTCMQFDLSRKGSLSDKHHRRAQNTWWWWWCF